MRALYSYGLAGLITLGAGAWLLTGTFVVGGNGPGNGEKPAVSLIEKDGGPLTDAVHATGLTAHSSTHNGIDPHLTILERVAQTTGASAPPRSVRTETFTLQAMPVEVPIRGRTKASAVVTVTPETSGAVQSVSVTKGQTVAVGDLLCTLDQGTRQAAVEQAEASLAQAQTQFDSNAELRAKGLAAKNTSATYESALKAAQAALDNAKAELARTEVRAQAAGVVQDPIASVGNMLTPGQPCATVVQLDPMLFVGTVPETKIAMARLDLDAKVQTVSGASGEGKVSYIASVADEGTRSFPIEIKVPNPGDKLLAGVTATATVSAGTIPAHLLPQSVLTLDDAGALGVRAVKAGKVEFYPVTIISDSREGVWVSGLSPSVEIITVGQEFVTPGQDVIATNVGPGESSPAAATAPAQGV